MKNFVVCLLFMFLFAGFAQAQRVKTMTGTVEKVILSNRWTGIVIKVGDEKYVVQTGFMPSAGEQQRGETSGYWQPKLIGNVDEVGQKVQVFYTKKDCTIELEDNVPCFLKATEIVEVKKTKSSKKK